MSRRRELAPARGQRRPHTQRKRRKRFLLFCEGEVTERNYFQDLARSLRSPLIEVKVAAEWRKDPKRLVELAKEARSEANRQARLARDDSLRYDEVWCVFDCDEHARLKPAIDQATALEIDIAVSNPCFDLWLLLHFQDQHAALTTKKACDAVRAHVPRYVKHLDFAKLAGHGGDAVARAGKLQATAQRNGDRYGNPTTGVGQLVARICDNSNIPLSGI